MRSHRWRVLLVGLLTVAKVGCTSMTGRDAPFLGPPADVGRLSLFVPNAPPRIHATGIPDRQQAAATAAGNFFLTCVTSFRGGGDFAGLAFVVWLGGCSVAMPIAAGIAAHEALAPDEATASTAAVTEAETFRRAALELSQAVQSAADELAPGRLVAPATGTSVDGELKVSLRSIELRGDGKPDPAVQIVMTVEAAVIRRDGSTAKSTSIEVASEMRKLSDWAANGGAYVQGATDRAMPLLAEAVVDFAYLLYPFPFRGIPHLATWYTGLQAEYPPRAGDFFDPLWAKVDTLRPTFRWEAFPRDVDFEVDPGTMKRVENVQYDLLIAEQSEGTAPRIVFRRTGIPTNSYPLDIELAPAQRFFWTVRARFTLDGGTYVTEWASRGDPRSAVPNQAGYPFKTPVAAQGRITH